MKKLLAAALLSFYIVGGACAQDLTTAYIAQCKEFIQFYKSDRYHARTIYIWSPRASDRAHSLFYEAPYDLKVDKPWKCHQSGCFRGGKVVLDTIKLSQADMDYMRSSLINELDTMWRTRFAASVGLLAEEPWVTRSTDNYYALSAPLFLQNGTVCVVYFLSECPDARLCGYEVYKKDSGDWAFVTTVNYSVADRGKIRPK